MNKYTKYKDDCNFIRYIKNSNILHKLGENHMKKFYIIIIILFSTYISIFAQQSTVPPSGITVRTGEQIFGFPYRFLTVAPDVYNKWELVISEFNGRVIFEDEGEQWLQNGYVWKFDSDIMVFSAVNYIVSISFFNDFEKLIKTEIKQFSILLGMNEQEAPTLFFDGYSTNISKDIFQNRNIDAVFDFIVEQAKGEFSSANIRLKGHAAIVDESDNNTVEGKSSLVALSKERTSFVLQELAKRGINEERVQIEALGGSEQLSSNEQQRWKNRRVEVIFSYPSISTPVVLEQDTILEQEDKEPEVIDRISVPQSDIPLIGEGKAGMKEIVAFILYNVPTLNVEYVEKIVSFYIQEANRENVNYDVAIAQMLLETSFLRFTGTVQKEQFNFAGIGAINQSTEGHWFPSELIGVRAHIQHLKGYATRSLLIGKLVDPRYPILERLGLIGSAPTVRGLSGRWAKEPDYGDKIFTIVKKLYNFANALLKTKNS